MNIPKYINQYRSDLEFKNYSKVTVKNYACLVRLFLKYFEVQFDEPKKISEKFIKDYLKESSSISVFKQNIGALKLFYQITIRQPLKFRFIEYPRPEKKSPIILSHDEIKALFNACENIKHKLIMYIAYGTGARVSEILNLRLTDIDYENGVIHVMAGKGNKQRQLTLKPRLADSIRDYISGYNPNEYLFNGQFSNQYSSSSINQFLKDYAKKAGIKKRVHIHLLRHNYATHCLDAGENLYTIQKSLGHASPKTTANNYLHMSSKIIANAYSPIDNL